jgi:hypothetical protein
VVVVGRTSASGWVSVPCVLVPSDGVFGRSDLAALRGCHTRECLFFVCSMQVVSTFITLALLGGAAYLYFRSSSSNDSSSSSGDSKGRGDDLDDPLADARRIMDKYK